MAFYYNPVTNEFESTLESLGTRFGLNKISTRAKTLSPTKSYAEKPYNWEEGNWWDLEDESVGGTKILEDFEITDEMRRRPNVEGGRIDLKPGGIVEPGVEYYANPEGRPDIKIKDWTSEQKANLKTWMKNTGSTLKDYHKQIWWNKKNIKYGKLTGIKQTGEFGKKLEGPKAKEFRNWLSKQDPATLTADSVDDLIKQSKIKTTSRTRHGLVNAINKIVQEKEFAKFKNIKLGRVYPSVEFDKFADAFLDAYTKDDITKIAGKYRTEIYRVKNNIFGSFDSLVKKTGLSEEIVFDLLDDRDAFQDLEMQGERGSEVAPDKAKFYKKAEDWIVKNSKRYEDPDKLKKAFTRTFGKNNHLIQLINKGTLTSVPFSDWFKKEIVGAVGPTYSRGQLNNIFKTAIYTNNKKVRSKIIDELIKVIPEEGTKQLPSKRTKDINKILNENPLLKKFGLNHEIRGPIARLLTKEIGEDLVKQIGRLRRPWLGTFDLIKYLKDRVNPEYKSMFEEAAKAVKHAQNTQWGEARKALNLSQSIMFDHKIPKSLMALGYADEIEYIKLQPASAEFNSTIKRLQFDMPIIKLTEKWKKAETSSAKEKIVREMNELKDKFSKKYGNYLDEVKITPDKTGKPIFSSTAEVVTQKTDFPKLLKTSLEHEKFPAMTEVQKSNFLKTLLQTAKTTKGPPRLKAIQLLLAAGVSMKLLNDHGISTAEAQTLEPSDKKQEAGISATDVGKGALATAAGYAITHPGKTLKAADKLIAPLLLPLPNIAMQAAAGDVDPTSAHTWLGPTFWKGAMESLNLTKDKWWHKALRAGMKPSTVAKVSGVSGPLLMATAPIDRGKAMSKTFKEAEELGIDVSEYVDRSSGVIEVTDDLYEEIRKRKSTQGMDYAQGGIASLIK